MPDRPGAPPRAWQRMLSGRRLDLLDPSPLDIEIADARKPPETISHAAPGRRLPPRAA